MTSSLRSSGSDASGSTRMKRAATLPQLDMSAAAQHRTRRISHARRAGDVLRRQDTDSTFSASDAGSIPISRRALNDQPFLDLSRRPEDQLVLFGSVRFPGVVRPPAKWACIGMESSDAEAKKIVNAMFETWKMPQPQALISVTGAASDKELSAHMSEKDLLVFRRGLQSAARLTRAWIITGGFNSGVMAAVGSTFTDLKVERKDALSKDRWVCLGIGVWNKVDRRELLEAHARGKILAYGKGEVAPGRAALDPNHTHFLLVDGGSSEEWGVEVELRAAVEGALCSIKDGGLETPRVLLLVNGGMVSLRVVLQALNHSQPVVALADSGGAATHLAQLWFYDVMPSREELDPSSVAEEGRVSGRVSTGRLRPHQLDEYFRLLQQIVDIGKIPQGANRRPHIFFFGKASEGEGRNDGLDQVIANAILSDCEKTQNAIQHAVMVRRA